MDIFFSILIFSVFILVIAMVASSDIWKPHPIILVSMFIGLACLLISLIITLNALHNDSSRNDETTFFFTKYPNTVLAAQGIPVRDSADTNDPN